MGCLVQPTPQRSTGTGQLVDNLPATDPSARRTSVQGAIEAHASRLAQRAAPRLLVRPPALHARRQAAPAGGAALDRYGTLVMVAVIAGPWTAVALSGV